MKQIHIHQPKLSRADKVKLFLQDNIFTPHKMALACAIILSYAISFVLNIWLALIPVYLHVALWLITYYRHTIQRKRNEAAWDRYVDKYGNDKGEIPVDIRMRHSKMIKEGKQIKL